MEITSCPNCDTEKTIWIWNKFGDELKCKNCKVKFTFKWFIYKGGTSCGIVGDYPVPPRPIYKGI